MDKQTFSDWIFTENADMEKGVLSTVRGDYSLKDIKEKRDFFISLLNEYGVIKGKKVGLLVPQVESYIALALAINQLGGIVIPLSWQFRKDDLTAVLDSLSPHIVFTVNEFSGFGFEDAINKWASEYDKEVIVYTSSKSNTDWGKFKFAGDKNPFVKDQVAVFGCSSGSTGIPKGLMLDVESLDFWLKCMRDYSELKKEDISFITIPPTAPWGLAWLLLGFKINSHVVFPDTFDPFSMGKLMKDKSCNKLFSTPSIFKALYKFVQTTNPIVLQNLKRVGLGGEMLTQDFIDLVKFLQDIQFTNIYGSSEGGPILFNDDIRKEGMKGLEGVEYRLLKLDDNDETGELLIRSKAIFSGYYERQDLTEEIVKDGWYYTGDSVKSLGNDKYLIIERIKNMIKKAGQSVIPGEVEYALTQHSNVKQAAVVGVPHKVYGEQVVAFVVVEEQLDEHELYSHCSKKIAAYKVPDKIIQVDEIPIIQGKTDRLTLKKMIKN